MTDNVNTTDRLFQLIESLSSVDAVSGDEGRFRSLLVERLSGLVDSVEEDPLGNLIAVRRTSGGGAARLLFACTDEPGLVVTHVDASGSLRVAPVGDLPAELALGAGVRFPGEVRGVIAGSREQGGSLDFASLRVDVGASNKEEAERLAPVGTRAAYDVPLARQGDSVLGKALDSKLGCAVLLEVLRRSKAEGICALFAAQERLGGRGLAAFASGGRGVAEAVGVSLADASPGSTSSTAISIGRGPALVVQDGSHVADPGLISRLEGAAGGAGIAVQRYVSKDGLKGPGHLQRAPGGISLAVLGIPARNVAGISQVARLADVAAAAELLVRWADGA